ncbi:MAG: orotate phosphoribosyltransferase [Deltaproteobacteria bacterium]|nr:orotate phosphoribosyltransferase [Deltaproteobacteria bacterium]
MKAELIDLLCEKSVNVADEPKFKLVSGRMSDFYVNCKPTTLHPRGMYLVGHLVMETLSDLSFAGIGGLTFGADPVAVAASFASGLINRPVTAFSIRKEPKKHGTGAWLEGDLSPGDRVVVVDDVVTTGGSTIKAIARAREEGLEVAAAVILVDREEGGMEAVRKHVPDVRAIITRTELLRRFRQRR